MEIITSKIENNNKREAGDLSPCNIKITVLSGEILKNYIPAERDGILYDEYAEFIIDLSSIRTPQPSTVIDFDHDSKEIIGVADNFRIEENKLVCNGALMPYSTTDRASEIIYKSKSVPFGISPTIDLISANKQSLKEGESIELNGQTYIGPLIVYKNVELVGVSVCAYPTDSQTGLELLKKRKIKTMKLKSKLSEEDVTTPETMEENQEAIQIKNPELQQYIDKFGLELGVEYYQKGIDFNEAMAEAIDTLKSQLEDANCNKNEDPPLEDLEDVIAPEEEDKKDESKSTSLSKKYKTLSGNIEKLAEIVAKLSVIVARNMGEKTPLNACFSKPKDGYNNSFINKFSK